MAKYFRLMLVGLLALPLLLPLAAWARVERVAIVLSNGGGVAYQDAFKGFAASASFQYTVFRLAPETLPAPVVAKKIISGKYTIVVLIGSEAFAVTPTLPARTHIVYSMVLESAALPNHPSSGIVLKVDMEDKFSRVSRMFPDKKRVGFMFNPRISSMQIMRARSLMDKYGLEVLPIAIEKPEGLTAGLKKASAQKVDYLWMVIDKTLARPDSVRQLVAYALDKKMLLIGFSKFHVKAGALAAFAADYSDIGAQTAVHVQKILSGKKTAKTEPPRKVLVYINPIVQEKLGIADLSAFKDVRKIK